MASRDSLLHNGDADSYNKLSDDYTNSDALSPSSAATTSSLSEKLRQHKRWVIAVVAVIVLIMLVAAAYAVIRKEEDERPARDRDTAYKTSYRLPHSVIPTAYSLDLLIDLTPSSLSFYGEVVITAAAVESTSQVVLHAQLMTIDQVTVRSSTGAQINSTWQLQEQSGDSEWVANQFLVIDLDYDRVLAPNESIELIIDYHAPLTNSLAGLYYSTYGTPAQPDVPIFIATTQFEPTDARRAFPCFDEPIFKATFDVSITAQSDHPTTLFNTMPESTRQLTINGTSWYQTTFARTPRMSTYLLAWVVCDFQSTTTNTSSGVVFSTWASPDQRNATINATYIGARQTEVYETLFNLRFPLPKQDMIAIPDFAAGAMENWGLITYRETAVLYNPIYNSASELQSIAQVIAHELGHQWFGDIVTMRWWSDIWLNEGFASWVQYIGVSHVYPDWQMEEQFLTNTAAQAFALDSLPAPATHPIINDKVQSTPEINSLFDAISYNKGACLIRHTVNIVGFDTFIRGINTYLKKYSYGNADSYELMQVLGAEGGVDLWALMNTFLTQPNYPLLILDEVISSETGLATMTVHQQRYLSVPGATADTSVAWNVPINYVIRNSDGGMQKQDSLVWLYSNTTSTKLPLSFNYGTQDYLKLNVNQSFFYRVHYPERMYRQFAAVLQTDNTRLSNRDRTNLLSDSFSLAYAGLLDWNLALNLTLFASQERELTPLTELIGQWNTLAQYFSEDDLTYLNSYVSYMIGDVYDYYAEIGFNPLGHIDNLIQARVLAAATRYNVRDSRQFVTTQFADFIDSDRTTRPWADIIGTVLVYGIREQAAAFGALYNWYLAETNAAESTRYLAAMASVNDASRLEQLLGYTLDGTIRTQDVATVMQLIIGNKRTVFWDWITRGDNWNTTFVKFESGYAGLGRVLSALISPIKTQAELDTTTGFFAGKQLGSAQSAYNAAVSNAKQNIVFVNGPYKVVRDWMVTFVQSHVDSAER